MLGLLRKGRGRKHLKISWPQIGVVLLCLSVLSGVVHAAKRGNGASDVLPEVFVAGKLSRSYQVADQVFSDLGGKQFSLSDFSGKVIVVVFWAPWSLDSVTLLQGAQDAKKHFDAKGMGDRIAFLPVCDTSIADLEAVEFARDGYGLDLSMYVDSGHSLFESFDITSIPLTLIIDGAGAVVYRIGGYFRLDHPKVWEELAGLFAKDKAGVDGVNQQ
ncbi:thiol-disulfide oxidoreductase ResA [Anaplasma platys]|uniref:Thiol-disulfide oxidoreductase ResA n=1 Tax=Anaplasma platys TaxID=949 RepID=A0A858PY64_9RICK|nr:thiol-disulfide oxidoreductase ResA [Anaplasma platys]